MNEDTLEEGKKTRSGSRFSAILIALVILIGIVGIVWRNSSKYEPVVVGAYAPAFTLTDMNGKEYTLSSLRGKVVFINFWATWCKSCKDEMPSMQILYTYLKEKNVPFEMLAISMDRVTTQKNIGTFVNSMGLKFPILLDPWGKTDGKYKLTGVPETYIIDKEGRLAEKVIGPRDWETVGAVQTIFKLLDIKPEAEAKGG
ncbi:MAG: TlpA family protein disulfide reductase [Nitrospirae bacterium]|nr:TlpA family protein disulfide reductase [Nitrospirota bacterium]